MERFTLYILPLLLLVSCTFPTARSEQRQHDSLPDNARRLIEAYPKEIAGYQDNMIIFADSTRLTFNDGVQRTIEEMHLQQDVKDIFFQEYDTTLFPPDYGYDPGRYRSAEFFDKIYGSTYEEVVANLVYVNWCPSFGCKPLLFNSRAGAAEALKRVSDEFEQHPELAEWVIDAQSFNYRPIFGINRKSPHGYGIAVDIAVARSHYWRFSYPDAVESTELKYQNLIDMRVVEIFEKHGFIWGGRWYHFDTMHFEYRPEMFTKPTQVVEQAAEECVDETETEAENNSSEEASTTEALSPETIS